MELITFNKTEYKRIERFRIATGAVAILAAVMCVPGMLSNFGSINSLGASYILIGTILSLLVLVAMILVAIFVFAYYGKKKTSLWGVSALLMAASQVMLILLSIIDLPITSEYSESVRSLFVLSNIIIPLLLFVVFLVITFAWFKEIKINVRVLSIILIFLSLLSGVIPRIFIPILQDTFNFYNIFAYLFASLLYIVPYLLFLPFCSKAHKRVSADQEQDVLIGDLDFQLTSLKRDFEDGKMTKQEFDFRRRSLIDKL